MNVSPAALTGALAALALTSLTFAEPKPEPAPTNPEHVSFDFEVNDRIRRIVIELNPGAAPQTVANFKKLIQEGFYNGLAIHRAIPHYLIQVGDPLTKDDSAKSTWGTGSPGYTIPAEIKLKHQRGCVAMARLPDGRNPTRASNGSQFYIALADMAQLDGQYTVFGQVVRGIEHLDYISERTTDTNDVPLERIKVAAVIGEGPSKTPPGEALAQGAGNVAKGAMSAASNGVRAAGAVVKDADKLIPKIDLPKVPFLGGKSEAPVEAPPAAGRHANCRCPCSSRTRTRSSGPRRRLPGSDPPRGAGRAGQGKARTEAPFPSKIPQAGRLRVPRPGARRRIDSDLVSGGGETHGSQTRRAQGSSPAQSRPNGAARRSCRSNGSSHRSGSIPPEGTKPAKEKVVVPVTPPAPKEKGFLGGAITRFW